MNVMIIPAAGRGTRLAFDGPKLLYPLDGRPLLDYLLSRYAPWVDHFVLVIHPDMKPQVDEFMSSSSCSYSIDFQVQATGMLDAIMMPLERIEHWDIAQIWITWCDQVGITAATAKRMHDLLEGQETPAIVLPTIHKTDPYIHLQRDDAGNICKVLQRREGDNMPPIGENDCGLFGLSRAAYFNLLPQFSQALSTDEQGSETRERNFLPFLSWLNGQASVTSFNAQGEVESVGINTVEDAQTLIRIWQQQ